MADLDPGPPLLFGPEQTLGANAAAGGAEAPEKKRRSITMGGISQVGRVGGF